MTSRPAASTTAARTRRSTPTPRTTPTTGPAELGRDLPPGIFGENLRVAGISATNAVIGERWKIGLDVEVEVTSPRTPCATFQRRMHEPHWVKRFGEAGRVGTYLRVVRVGSIQAGDHIHRIFVPTHGVTIGKWFSDPTVEDMEALRDADADGEIRLQPEYHAGVREAAAPPRRVARRRGRAVCASSPPSSAPELPMCGSMPYT